MNLNLNEETYLSAARAHHLSSSGSIAPYTTHRNGTSSVGLPIPRRFYFQIRTLIPATRGRWVMCMHGSTQPVIAPCKPLVPVRVQSSMAPRVNSQPTEHTGRRKTRSVASLTPPLTERTHQIRGRFNLALVLVIKRPSPFERAS